MTKRIDPGHKFDADKAPLALVDPEFVHGVARALAYGAEKYEPWNHLGGFEVSRCASSVLRHVYDYLLGEEDDPESGVHHLSMAGAQLQFLHRQAHHPELYGHLDDRPDFAGVEVREAGGGR